LQTENDIKEVEILRNQARDIVDDSRRSYDQKITELATLSTAYQLSQHLDPNSLENVEKHLRVLRTTEAITKPQNLDTENDESTKEADDELAKRLGRPVPPEEHLDNEGIARRKAAGTYQKPSAPKEIEVVDPDGKPIRNGAAYMDQSGDWH